MVKSRGRRLYQYAAGKWTDNVVQWPSGSSSHTTVSFQCKRKKNWVKGQEVCTIMQQYVVKLGSGWWLSQLWLCKASLGNPCCLRGQTGSWEMNIAAQGTALPSRITDFIGGGVLPLDGLLFLGSKVTADLEWSILVALWKSGTEHGKTLTERPRLS